MKPYITILLLIVSEVSAAALEARLACNQDNCYNAVRATKREAFASSDCLNFLATVTGTPTSYITLPASTITSTIYSIFSAPPTKRSESNKVALEIIPRDPNPGDLAPRVTSSPTGTATIPAYASACSGSVRYSSACSCLGVSAGPITVSSTVTSTVTPAVVTQTSTVVACDPTNNYGLLYNGGSWANPSGTTPDYNQLVSSDATAYECCNLCFTTKDCILYEYLPDFKSCYLTGFHGGPVVNPHDKLCPNGKGMVEFGPGSAYGYGPCTQPWNIG